MILEGACKERGVGMAISNFNTCTNTHSNTHTHQLAVVGELGFLIAGSHRWDA